MTVTQLAIKRPTLVVVLFTVLVLLGVTCYSKLNYDLLPKMNIPVVSVTTTYAGASASEVESSVTKKIEDALSSLENIKDMQSTSQEGVSNVTIELEASADVNLALEDAQRKVNAVLSTLPVNAKAPSISKFSTDDMPVFKMGITGQIPPTQLYQLVKDQIKPQFAKLKGVGNVSLIGGDERQIKIDINKKKLDSYKVSIYQVYSAVSNANLELPTGNIKGETRQYTVRLSGKIKTLDDLKNMTVSRTQSGSLIKLSDVADVLDAAADPDNITRINGKPSVGMVIQKQSDANTVDVCKQSREQIKALEKIYASNGVKFDIASDSSTYTLDSANAVMEDLGLAILIVAIVMFLFLHSVRNSFIVLISIPCSIISVFVAMYVFDFSLNLMTLMALSLVVGVLVDDSIVVLENIFRHLEMGKTRRQAALDGRNEIGFSAVAITMVDIVVFVPLSLVSGMIGNILREFALVIVFSTLMSLFVSFTVTPLLASRFSKIERQTRNTLFGRLAIGFESLFHSITRFYERVLRWGLGHRKVVYGIVTLLIVGSFSLVGFGFIGSEFFAQSDRGEFLIQIEGEPQNTLYQTNMLTQKVEHLLYSKPEVLKVFTNVGYSSTNKGTGSTVNNKSEITVDIVSKEKRKVGIEQFASQIKREILSTIPGIKVTSTPVSMTGNADAAPIQVLLRGPDVKRLFMMGDSVMKIMNRVPGTKDVKLSIDNSNPEMQISLDREKMAMLGLSVYDVSNTLRLAFAGNDDLQYSEKGTDYDINVQFDQFNRKRIEDIGSLTLVNSQGKVIELRDFADIHQSLGPNKLERYDRISSLTVNASVFNRPVGTVGEEIKQIVSKTLHPGEITIDYKGQLERQSEAFGSLGMAILAALIFVYLVMVALYNSYLYPFVVLFSIPVAIVGALLALALTGNSLSIFTIIGFIMLIGLVAKNAILLVDFANQAREKGASVTDALIEAGKERLRPIMMTTLAMVLGMLPIALSTGASSESKSGLAWVIIGGLSSSLLLTLILVPSVYASMESYKAKLKRRFGKKDHSREITTPSNLIVNLEDVSN